MSFNFSIELCNESNSDYIIIFSKSFKPISNTIEISNNVSKYLNNEGNDIIINLEYNDINIINHSTEIKNEFIKQIKQIKDLNILNIINEDFSNINENINVLYMKYYKHNDLKFFRILKNIIQEYKVFCTIENKNNELYVNSFGVENYCKCNIYNPKYNIEGYSIPEYIEYKNKNGNISKSYRSFNIYKLLQQEYKYGVLLYMSVDDLNCNFHYMCYTDSDSNIDDGYINYNINNLIKYYSRIYNILSEEDINIKDNIKNENNINKEDEDEDKDKNKNKNKEDEDEDKDKINKEDKENEINIKDKENDENNIKNEIKNDKYKENDKNKDKDKENDEKDLKISSLLSQIEKLIIENEKYKIKIQQLEDENADLYSKMF